MAKTQIGPLITEEAKAMLLLMAYDDRRSMGNWLEQMIRLEYTRRLEATLSGSSFYHGDMRERMNDMHRQVIKREAERKTEQETEEETRYG